MNELICSNSTLVMTSREIADLVESRHDHVKTSIERLVSSGAISRPALRDGARAGNGVVEKLYVISKRDTYVIVAQLSPAFTARLVDRWQELEAQSKVALPSSFAAALRLAAEQQEQIEQQALRIATDAPKVEFAETICNTDGVCKMGQFAKTIGWGPNRFIDRLRTDEVLMQNNLPFQKFIDRGYFRVIEKKPWTDSSGNEHPSFTTMVTGRGQVWLAKHYAQEAAVPA